jgi:hypothetical protein
MTNKQLAVGSWQLAVGNPTLERNCSRGLTADCLLPTAY